MKKRKGRRIEANKSDLCILKRKQSRWKQWTIRNKHSTSSVVVVVSFHLFNFGPLRYWRVRLSLHKQTHLLSHSFLLCVSHYYSSSSFNSFIYFPPYSYTITISHTPPFSFSLLTIHIQWLFKLNTLPMHSFSTPKTTNKVNMIFHYNNNNNLIINQIWSSSTLQVCFFITFFYVYVSV